MKEQRVSTLPLIVSLPDLTSDEFIAYFAENKRNINQQLRKVGAIKFRGVEIDTVTTFQKITDAISTRFLSYVDGNSPRTKLTNAVYTSTEYDQTQEITMHNELSYSAKWPNKLFLSCLQPAETGGETLLADSREILAAMNPEIVAEIENRGITYVRNLHGGLGMGPSWQDTFETKDKSQVESFFATNRIDYEWREDNALRLNQHSKGIITHHKTGERLWFNQIDQFHPYHLGEELYETLLSIYDSAEEFPMYVRFGDGKVIREEMVQEILSTIRSLTYAPAWKQNELLIIDNELVCHGRSSYTGSRKVIVAMSE